MSIYIKQLTLTLSTHHKEPLRNIDEVFKKRALLKKVDSTVDSL